MPIEVLVLGGGSVVSGLLGGGRMCRFYFYGRRDSSEFGKPLARVHA